MFDDISNFANSVDGKFLFTLIVSVFFLVLITVLMIFFVIKYSRKRNPKGTNIHGNMGLEIAWKAIPTILVMIMFYYGWQGYKEMVNVPENAMAIDVTAQTLLRLPDAGANAADDRSSPASIQDAGANVDDA